ncbi:hypothetical protein THERMOT_1646 [Bathymodiolus thermophilus thioautotrophic gill symbiont]|nr:hypothetical protein THERMOT_1646 [Bathymodiolus thermophilus thioautotrophic gill symbiont]
MSIVIGHFKVDFRKKWRFILLQRFGRKVKKPLKKLNKRGGKK